MFFQLFSPKHRARSKGKQAAEKWINRRLYKFESDRTNPRQGLLTLGGKTYGARKTGRTFKSFITMDTMTGRKRILQYYDEFQTLDARYQLGGDKDMPQWVESSFQA